jgi:hypothetical protein
MLDAAAELRRLAGIEDEWMALSQDQNKAEGQIDRLEAQRDALLEALKLIVESVETPTESKVFVMRIRKGRATIKAVEGEKE